ncbi:hypothetical protein LCGC14_2677560, partial [marine sediment metagenome]
MFLDRERAGKIEADGFFAGAD